MKKNFKGFTLVECIVAMAILAVASLLIAQIYGAVSVRNRMNHLVNSSLVSQMAYVEKYTNSDVVPLYYGNNQNMKDSHSVDAAGSGGDGKPPHVRTSSNSGYNSYVQFESNYSIKFYTGSPQDMVYSYAADVYILKSRDRQGNVLTTAGDAGYKEDSYNLRYKYILGHKN